MNEKVNALNWFEIPVSDLSRAIDFYESVFEIEMAEEEMMGMEMAFFPFEAGNGKASGGLVKSESHVPSKQGTIVYLNANQGMEEIIDRIEENGGTITLPRTDIGDSGFMAMFLDTEGNMVGLHSNQ